MKFLVLAVCVGVSTAGLVAHHNGAVVPADTPDVAAAKLAHAAAGGVINPEGIYTHGYAAAYPYGHAGFLGGLVGHANGAVVPVDTPDVVAAKAAHAAAGGAIHAPTAYTGYAAAYPYGHAGYLGGLVGHANGAVVPVDTPDVVAAKAAHAAAGGAIHAPTAYAGYAHGYGYAAGYPYGHAGYLGGLVGHGNGAVVPVDTPDVVAAKAAHAAAGGAIHAPTAYTGYPHGYGYAAGYPYGYAGYPYGAVPVHTGFHGLVAHPNGAVVPAEPADVVAARAEHLAALAKA